MSGRVHTAYIAVLFIAGITTAVVTGIDGCRYYTTSQERISNMKADLDAKRSDIDVEIEMLRQGLGTSGKSEAALRREKDELRKQADYWERWKSSGRVGHGLGIIGSLMMIIGVAMYSSRKRLKRLRYAGKIKHWLEFHIFLCLLGPTLVVFHTTFRFGGIVAISAWSMMFVALSGLLGRYIYTQIPKTIEGNELTLDDLAQENARLQIELRTHYDLDEEAIDQLNRINSLSPARGESGAIRAIASLIRDDMSRRARLRTFSAYLDAQGLGSGHHRDIMRIARQKSLLLRRIAFLDTARAIFHYWHVIHLPFSIIMFLILAIHVAVTVSLGYKWIF